MLVRCILDAALHLGEHRFEDLAHRSVKYFLG